MWISFNTLLYLVHVRPFDEPILNKLEIFNESKLYLCTFMLTMAEFSEILPTA